MRIVLTTFLLILIYSVNIFSQSPQIKAPFRFAEVTLHDPSQVAASFENDEARYFFIKWEEHENLSMLSLEDEYYIGENTYLIRSRPSQLSWWDKENLIKAWAPYPNEMKVHPALKESSEVPVLEVVLNRTYSFETIMDVLHQHRIPVEKRLNGSDYAVIKNEEGVIDQLKSLDIVVFIHPGGRKSEPEDLRSKRLHRSDLLEGPGDGDLGYDGEGVSVLVRDDGMIGPHLDFKGRLFNDPDLPFETNRTHGDGVAGIIGAAGSVEKEGRGMAPGANIYATRYESSFMDNTLQLHIDDDVLYTNSSYSNGCNDGYTPNAAEVDRQIYEYPTLLHIFSAGNDGNSDCGYGAGSNWGNITGGHKQAKNSIATANVNPSGGIISHSSRGPATDGRIKPDIAANGNNNYSTNPNNRYEPFGGTSGAAPCVAGVAAQLCEAFRSVYGQTPPSALIKAALLNAADDKGVPGPDFIYGWGLLDAFGAYSILENEQFVAQAIAENEEVVIPVPMPDSAVEAKLMIYWADVPGSPMAAKALVNNLDMSVSYMGTDHLPLILKHQPNQFTLDDPAQPGIDTLNNMEQVVLENISGDTAYVSIKGTEIPSGLQEFYLVWEVAEPEPGFSWVQPRDGHLFEPGDGVPMQWINNISNTNEKTIIYSKDGGITWEEKIAFSSQDFYTLNVDSIKSGDSLMVGVIEAGYADTLDGIVYFAEQHSKEEIFVDQVCPREATISWSPKPNADSYRVYTLGEKYMEVVAETTDTFFVLPVRDLNNGQLYAVSASYNGIWAPRSDGQLYEGGLLNCPQLVELSADSIQVLNRKQIYYCSPFDLQVTAKVANMGIEDVDSFQVCYRLGDDDPSCQWYTFNFRSGTDTLLTLDSLFNVDTTRRQLEYWVYAPGDEFYFNDTMTMPVTIDFLTEDMKVDTLNLKFEDFRLPVLSRVLNPDDGLTWDWVFGTNKANENSQMLVMANYFYEELGEQDVFYTPVVKLDSFADPQLIFDYAYSGIAGSPDELMVVVAEPCDIYNADTLWKGQGLDMATADVGFDNFDVSNYDQWESVRLPLTEYIGREIVIGFISVNQYGNNIFIDNLAIMPDSTYQHEISAQVSPNDIACPDSVVQLTVDIEGSGDFNTKWFNTTVRSNESTDTFRFEANDLFTSFVVFVSNQYYTTYEPISIGLYENPRVGPRLVSQVEDTAVIASRAINADSIVWFGDNGAVLRGDTVTYVRQNGEGTVRFTAIAYGKCAQASRGITLDFTVNSESAFGSKIVAYPNPLQGKRLYISGLENMNVEKIRVYDAQSRFVQEYQTLQTGNTIEVNWPTSLGSGMYFIELWRSDRPISERIKVLRL